MNKTIAEIKALGKGDSIGETQLTVQTKKGTNNPNGKTVTNYVMLDASGASIDVGMFGQENANWQSGQTLIIKSSQGKGVIVAEWKDVKSITVFDNAIVSPSQASVPQQEQYQQPTQQTTHPAQATSTSAGNLDIQAMSRIWAKAYVAMKQSLAGLGVVGEEAERASVEAAKLVPLYWFGKSPDKTSGL